VREDMAVVCPEGLVGRVYDVAPRISWILPLVHPDCRVSALVRRSRVLGIVEWRPGRELVLAKIPRLADVAPGDLVVSSGLGGVFPAGWPVGEAVGLTEEFGGLLNHVRLTPRVDFNRLEEVFILLESAAPEGEELGGYPPGHEPEDAAGRGAETP
jgi:rod shape-determining protein MreC